MNGLLGAIQFLTRVPVSVKAAVPHERVVPWFPIVGALIGATVGGVAAGLGSLVPVGVAGTCAVLVGLIVTGAFHEDGLGDIADAFGGGWTRERRMEILKDSRHGTYGVTAISGSIVLRVVCAASIATPAAVFVAFLAAQTLGRSAAVIAMKTAPPATDSGLGVGAARSLHTGRTIAGLAAGVGLTAVVSGWWVLPFLGAALVATAAVVTLAVRKIGGLVGDVLGAVEVVTECLVLVVATGLASRSTVWWS